MGYLRGDESHLRNAEEREEEYMLSEALARRDSIIDTLTYNNYRWQREFHGLAADRLAKVFPRAEKYEQEYQAELARRAA